MIALQIMEIKDFMNKLLRTAMCDHFLLQEADITQNVTYSINGSLQKSFYNADEQEELGLGGLAFAPFSLLRGNCFDLIRGKKTPIYFKFVFSLSPQNIENTLRHTASSFTAQDIFSMNMIFTFQNGKLICTTGISYRTFSMDRMLEKEWDILVQKFLSKNQITYEML